MTNYPPNSGGDHEDACNCDNCTVGKKQQDEKIKKFKK